MDPHNFDNVKVRKFTHKNIVRYLDPDNKDLLESEILREIESTAVKTKYISLKANSLEKIPLYYYHSMFLPVASYSMIRDHILPAYKLLKYSNNFENIKRIFLFSYSHLAIKDTTFFSAYNYYETIFNTNVEIDTQVYDDLMQHYVVKENCEKFEIINSIFTYFVEDNNIIVDKEEKIYESIEDSEFSFDLHLTILSVLFKGKKIKIVPIWLNDKNIRNVIGFSDALKKYSSNLENFFIFSGNITYFGKMYNYFTENEKFKSKTFLKDKDSEKEIVSYLKGLIDEGFNDLFDQSYEKIMEMAHFNYCRSLLCLSRLLTNELGLMFDILKFSSIKQISNEAKDDINLILYQSCYYCYKNS